MSESVSPRAGEANENQAYVTLQDANNWFSARAVDAWHSASEEARRGVLLRASEWVDGYFRFRGKPARAHQPRAWPRVGVVLKNGDLSGPLAAPSAVSEATLELALALLDGDGSAEQLLGARGPVRSERIGTISVSYETPAAGQGPRLLQLLSPYLDTETSNRIVRS